MTRYLHQRFGDYRLIRLLGSGGFAEVYEAEHLHLPGVKAAIKLLKGSFTPQQIGELRKEAHIVSSLAHPHIVQLHTFSVEHTIPYLVMSYAQGGPLDKRHPRGTRLSLPEVLFYVRPIAQALQYTHLRHVVHRDLKPANLLLTEDGRVQIADFGIAVVVHSSTSRTIQEIAGTWAYMAPEQFHGLAEPASDQYALAIIVYQWLCGNIPFDGDGNVYLIPQQQQEQPPPSLCEKLPDLSPSIEHVVMKALAKNPEERFASIQEFAEALEEACKPPFIPAPGQRLGDYLLVRKLGEGGFAEVYEAEHLHLGTRAAIKLLKGTFSPSQVEKLRQEARSVMQLDHPHIIRAYGFSIERRLPYLVLAYAPGGSLAARYSQGTRLPLEIILEYVRQISAALQYAHDQGITHRDIKPDNILLAQDGRVQVADFGIAVMTQATQDAQEIVGSWVYMAPEQFEGKAEPASDQYSLGIMVYQWLCGEPPFTGNGNMYILPYQQMNVPPSSLHDRVPDLSPRVEQVVMKALAKESRERFASMHAFAQAFEKASATPVAGITLLTYEHLGGEINSVAWSPDETYIASGGADATVRIWDASMGQTLLTRRGHSASVNAMAWSPDGRLVVSGSDDKTAQVWEVATGKLLCCYKGHSDKVNAVAWSTNGQLVISGSDDKSVQVWEVATGKLLYRYEGRSYSMTGQAWSADRLLIASTGGIVQIWEVATGRLLHRYKSHSYLMTTLVWSFDGRLIASAGDNDKTIQVWEAITGKVLNRYEGHSYKVNAVAWSANGLIASVSGDRWASYDKSVQVWEAATGKLLCRYEGHSDKVNAVVWSPRKPLIASVGSDENGNSNVQIWEATTGKVLNRYEGHSYKVNAVAWSAGGQMIVSGSDDGTVQVWEATTGKVLNCYEGHSNKVNAVAWSPDGKLVISGSDDKSVQVWEATTGKLLYCYRRHSFKVNAMAWSPDGLLVASASMDWWDEGDCSSSVCVWETATGNTLNRYEGHSYSVNAVAWSPDGKLVASAGSDEDNEMDESIDVWEVATGKLLYRYKGHSAQVNAMAWSPDGRLVTSGSDDKSVQVWEATTGKLLHGYKGHSGEVNTVAWSPDGRLISSGGGDGIVQEWEAFTGKVCLTYHDHFTPVFALAWSPDGTRIVSAGYGVHVWQVV